MARIRTIKPEFFRHEGLQDLAIEHGAHVMLVFAGLWGHCDKAGRFEWRPRQLKLDILPFLDFDMAETLEILEAAGMVDRYEVDGKAYGAIDSFREHQRLSGKEQQEPEKHPEPPEKQRISNGEATGKQLGSTGDQMESQEGKGREEEGNGGLPPSEVGKTGKPVCPPCPIDEVISLYHQTLPTNPRMRVRSGARDSHIRARWQQFFVSGDFVDKPGGLDCMRWFFSEKVSRSRFLTGQSEARNGRKPFVADLAWLMKAENFAKVIEGKYE